MDKQPFTHSEQPREQLRSRSDELNKLLDINHNPERYNQIINELSCIALEIWYRNENGIA